MTRDSILSALVVLAGACSGPAPDAAGGASQPEADQATAGQAAFTDRVWRVVESPHVAEGSLRVFLTGGTMVMDAPHAEPAFGTWALEDGDLFITEEGIRYPVEIVTLNDRTFRILVRGPGEPVDIRFERADQGEEVVFEARGHEPGWFLEVVQDRWIHVVYDYGEAEAYVPIPEPTVEGETGSTTYRATTEATALTLTIEPTTCSAPGTGEPRPSTVTVEIDGRTLSGCGGTMPEPPAGA